MRQREGLRSNGTELCCHHQFYFERDGPENGFGSGWHICKDQAAGQRSDSRTPRQGLMAAFISEERWNL